MSVYVGFDVAMTTGATAHVDGRWIASTFSAKAPFKRKSKQERVEEALGMKVSSLDAEYVGSVVADFERQVWIYLTDIAERFGPISGVAVEKPLVPNHQRTKTVIDTETQWAGKSVRKEAVQGTNEATIHLLHVLAGTVAKVCAVLNIPCEFIDQTTWRKDFLGNGRPGNREQCKKLAVQVCKQMGIPVPNVDGAESVGVCYSLVLKKNPYGGRANDLFGAKKPLAKTPAQEKAKEEAEALFRK